jgi:hypothetical protein
VFMFMLVFALMLMFGPMLVFVLMFMFDFALMLVCVQLFRLGRGGRAPFSVVFCRRLARNLGDMMFFM